MQSTTRDAGIAASACLDDETLCAFLEGRLTPSVVTLIDDHTASCAGCRELVAAGARVATESVARPARVGASMLLDAAPKRKGRVGTVLKDKWHLDALVGAGGMAEVYSGTHRNGKRVAIKVLLPQLAVDPELCRRFVQEGYIANQVGHPGVVAVHDDDVTDDGAPFLVMDLLEGECVSDIIGRGKIPVAEAIRMTRGLLAILAAAHARGVLHRDIKPGNIFRTSNGEIRLLDFGVARLTASTTNATVTGATMGTPAYMPPEQARGIMRDVDARSDVWAAAATLFSMLTGMKVREGESNNAILISAATQPIPPTHERAPWLSAGLAEVLDKALAFDKANRYASAAEMELALATLPLDALSDIGTASTLFMPQQRQPSLPPTIAAATPAPTMMASARSVPPQATVANRPSKSSSKTLAVLGVSACAFVAAAAMVASAMGKHPAPAAAASPPTPPTSLVGPTPTAEMAPNVDVSQTPAPPLDRAPAGQASATRPTSTSAKAKTSAPAKAADPYDRRL